MAEKVTITVTCGLISKSEILTGSDQRHTSTILNLWIRTADSFYERWGDAPVHSIAAGLLLKKEEIHFFNDIAYYHVPFTHCPTGEKTRLDLKCHCNPKDNFDWKGYSCTSRFFDINGYTRPEGYENQQD